MGAMDARAFLREITAESRYRDQIVHVREIPARPAEYAEPARPSTATRTCTAVTQCPTSRPPSSCWSRSRGQRWPR